jgi:hypothetical protein
MFALLTAGDVTHPDDWYKLQYKHIQSKGGEGVLARYGGSLSSALADLYPQYKIAPWRFSVSPRNYWKSPENVDSYIQSLTKNLGITKTQDWNDLTHRYLTSLKFGTLIKQNKGLANFLQSRFPNEIWQQPVKASPSKSQIFLAKMLQTIFPFEHIVLEYGHPDLVYTHTRRRMYLDVFIPNLSLAFEYHGIQHYNHHFKYGNPTEQQTRDKEKEQACKREGITLITIPFWWDNARASLVATILKFYPVAISDPGTATPIPDTYPKAPLLSHYSVHNTVPLLGQEFISWYGKNIVDWQFANLPKTYARVYWDGSNLYFMNSTKILVPPEFSSLFSGISMHGLLTLKETNELDYDLFSAVKLEKEKWKELLFIVLDVVDLNRPYMKLEERIALMNNVLGSNSHVVTLNFKMCSSQDQLQESLKKASGGLILRSLSSFFYQSQSFMKYQTTTEVGALVTQNTDGRITFKM